MSDKFPANDLQYAISSLSNLLSVGIPSADAFREMQFLQPKQAEFWKQSSKLSANGQSLAETLKPILDTSTYAAIHAAENSGTLTEVFAALEKAMEEKRAIRKTMLSIVYPFGMLIAAIGVFLLFLAFVVPALSKSIPNGGEKSSLNVIAESLHDFLVTYDMHIGIGVAIAVALLVHWLRNPDNRNTIVSMIDQIPLLGVATRDLYYGEWATHMAINTHAGITVIDAIKLTYKMMPAYYHPEVLAVARDATRIGLAAASSPTHGANDPRSKIPFLVANAFRFADRTGSTDIHFQRAGNALIVQGKKRIDLFVSVATSIIIPFAAIINAGAILPYFMQISDSISKLH